MFGRAEPLLAFAQVAQTLIQSGIETIVGHTTQGTLTGL
jgi:hypothetical protein